MNKETCTAVSLDSILEYQNNAVVQRISEKLELDDEKARELFADCLRFLWLTEMEDKPIAPSPKIDEAWHIFLLFTLDYQEFCQECFGRFKHHRPRRPEDPKDDGSVLTRTFEAVEAHLGGFSNLSKNWVYSKESCVSCDTPSTNCQN